MSYRDTESKKTAKKKAAIYVFSQLCVSVAQKKTE
jgi:hypothetical protein